MNGCYVYVCGRRLATAAQSSVFNIDRKLVRSGHRRTASVKGGCERVARKGVAARLDNVPCRRARRAERRILRLRAARDFEEAIVDALVCECDVQHAAAVGARRWNGWGAAPRKACVCAWGKVILWVMYCVPVAPAVLHHGMSVTPLWWSRADSATSTAAPP